MERFSLNSLVGLYRSAVFYSDRLMIFEEVIKIDMKYKENWSTWDYYQKTLIKHKQFVSGQNNKVIVTWEAS